ncbi:MAG: hypothetical protein K6T75_03880 [Acetobacteraceae bacterium]|nr:hypothetical protein [Acetobacteraceae bacterium]
MRRSFKAGAVSLALALLLAALTLGPLALAAPATPAAAQGPQLVVMGPGRLNLRPQAAEWRIPVAAFVPGGPQGWSVQVDSVQVDGVEVPFEVRPDPSDPSGATFNPAGRALPVTGAEGRFSGAELARLAALRAQVDLRRPLAPGDASFWQATFPRWVEFVAGLNPRATGRSPLARVVLNALQLFPDRKGGDLYQVRIYLGAKGPGRAAAQAVLECQVGIAAYPAEGLWVAGDLHLHSDYSDGWDDIATLVSDWEYYGYSFIYLTDHSNSVGPYWSSYVSECQSSSTSNCAAFPGTETDVTTGGHMTAFGVANTSGLGQGVYSGQQAIDNANSNNPSQPSSACIAHPTNLLYSWGDWTVRRYRGIEIMAAYQLSFGPDASPMARWRSETQRLLQDTFRYGYMPSVRTGSDWHNWLVSSIAFGTYTYVPSDWLSKAWADKKKDVDAALHAGRTVASNWGSCALLRINGNPIGTVMEGVAAGTNLSFVVKLYPSYTDTYRVRVYRSNMAQVLFDTTVSLSAGSYKEWTFNHSFPGGDQWYWVYVSNGDDVYTTPIYVSSNVY